MPTGKAATFSSIQTTNCAAHLSRSASRSGLRSEIWDLSLRSLPVQHQSDRRSLSKCLLAAGMLALALFVVAFTSEPARAQTFTTLYSFPGGSQGYGPSDIIVAPNGTIFGSAFYDPVARAISFSVWRTANLPCCIVGRTSRPHAADSARTTAEWKRQVLLFGHGSIGGPTNDNCFAGPQRLRLRLCLRSDHRQVQSALYLHRNPGRHESGGRSDSNVQLAVRSYLGWRHWWLGILLPRHHDR